MLKHFPRTIALYFILIFALASRVSSQPRPYGFYIQYIGNIRYVTPEEELKRDYCENYWCTNDAHYLLTKSSQYPNVDPCVDFKNFSVNHVEEVDAPDDRKYYRGFLTIIETKYIERMRKSVAARFDPVMDENSRIIKVVKNTFQQCLKSPHVLRHIQAHKDIVEHLQALGGSPYLSKHVHFNPDKFNETSYYGFDAIGEQTVPSDFSNEDELWSGDSFNISRYFEVEPAFAIDLFFDLEVRRCGDQICLKKPASSWSYIPDEEYDFESHKELLRTLDDAFFTGPKLKKVLIEQVYRPTVKRKREYLKSRDEIKNRLKNHQPTRIKVRDLRGKFPADFSIDWLQVVNSQLFEQSRVTEDDEIAVEGGVELLQALVRNLMGTDKR